ncbi:MAG: HDOD domain-containing protein [Sphaerobacter sp.]|nr:HDOD domain-containing protein [Sphaerobacter sp.]
MADFFIGRQPIYDRDLQVFGYELLFRTADSSRAQIVDADRATSDVVLDALVELGLDRLVGNRRAFINLTRNFILRGYYAALPAHRVVLEVLESEPVDRSLVDAVRELAAAGYTVALDDFDYRDDLRPLVDAATIVKLDIAALGRAGIEANLRRLRGHDLRLLAEKVETPEDFALCRDLGFDYFQGYFLCRPDLVRGRRMPTNRFAILPLLAKLQSPETDFSELEALITHDVSLSYKLLSLINSAFYGRPKRVESVRQALILLGTQLVSTWVSVIAMASIEDKPAELMTTAMVRGRMCEMLARAQRVPNKDMYFTAGLFSVLDALLDTPMAEILERLPLAEEVSQALLEGTGPLGATLRVVLAYERAEWDAVTLPGVEPYVIAAAYLDAIAWAHELRSALAD